MGTNAHLLVFPVPEHACVRTGNGGAMKAYVYRYWWFVCGLIINSFGIAVVTRSALGTSPISSVPFVLSSQFDLSLGQFTFIINSCFIVLQIILLRKNFNPIQLLQVFANILFSSFLDINMHLLSWMQFSSWPVQVVSVLIGCSIMALGISIEVAPNVLFVPGEGFVKAVSTVTGIRFGNIKTVFDSTLVASAVILSFVFFGTLVGVGVGTMLTALTVGRFVNLFNSKLPLIAWIARTSAQATVEPAEA